MVSKFMKSLKFIKLKDILAILIFILMIVPSIIYKMYLKISNKKIWIICEDPNEARDNGYHLFKYIRINHKNDYVYYAINKKSEDYKKIEKYGNIVSFGSLKHWLYYLCADLNISTHKYGNPNPPLFYVLQVSGLLKNKRIFLQHGITMNNVSFVNYKNSKFRLFICAAKREYEFVKENFGYPEDYVKLLGFSRFDNLYNNKVNQKQIVIMPTWRSYISKNNLNFLETDYYKKYYSLINNKKLINYIEKNKIKIYFYLHRNMQKYEKYFNSISKSIIIVRNNEIDIQKLLKDSALLITDYSSVSLDFAYMNKPLIYYQFDQEEFIKNHLDSGYFSYSKDGFGPVIIEEGNLVKKICNYIDNDYEIEKKYQKRCDDFFELRDQNNSERIYEELKRI